MLPVWSLSLMLAVLPLATGVPVARDDFSADQGRWVVEQMPGGKVTIGGGALTIEDAADTLGISAPTAKRDWTYARAWLFRELQGESRDRL